MPESSNANSNIDDERTASETIESDIAANIIHQRVIEAIADVVPETAKEDVAGKVISIITEEIETYSGVVPHPKHAEHWEKIVPGAADRILRIAERRSDGLLEQTRSHERIELAEIDREDKANRRLSIFKMGGLITGFLLGLFMVGGAIYTATHGQLALAVLLVGASALGTIGYFVNSNWYHSSPMSTNVDLREFENSSAQSIK